MPHYNKNYITRAVLKADFAANTVPMIQPEEGILAALEGLPVRDRQNKQKSEIRIRKTPQGPTRDTHTTNFAEYNFYSEDRSRRLALASEYLQAEVRRYDGWEPLRDSFLDTLDAMAGQYPGMVIRRLGVRFINEIRLAETDEGEGSSADFWQRYINPLLLGGLRFAANDGALARHMCTTELNYGSDRATIKYGIFNGEYPRPNRRREFILDIDAFSEARTEPSAVSAKTEDCHKAIVSVFEAAITDALRTKMGMGL